MKFFNISWLVLGLLAPGTVLAEEKHGELTLHIMPAYPVKMNWGSPREILRSSLWGSLLNGALPIGHVSVEVACGLREGEILPANPDASNYVLSSATPDLKRDPTVKLLLQRKIGLSLMESSWAGAVETPAQVKGSFAIVRNNPKRFSAVTFLIPEASCRRLITYFREYAAAAPNLYYGNSPRPRRKEGAGCTSFAVSFLELAGLLTEEFRREWAVVVRVPLRLMAGYAGTKKISIWEVLRSPYAREWARASEPHMELETFDPYYMHQWVRGLVASPQALRELGGELNLNLPHGIKGIPAIRIDRRHVPTPTEPIFEGPPALFRNSDFTVIRFDKVYKEDGSFELRP